ncbi:Bug family tripartite tricarboxylate transporter substrate binding protein [Roseomonas populi]|uniref:Tripartite tricarboxylate transporter substrate binding protein n=1 Tax=Roseomonas populi TaxID=3121582 RepID=A0ABT1XCZ3_9PROT|nr:tripartite tricarboxylate transporter substrate binding protein [Roseomonas pecuniae]MCR0984859.1 tripartite tricarboxylate transporter substrate binding protein [Roseomonas pecuniae]
MAPTRRALLGAASHALAAPAMAQGGWRPRRPVRIIVPFAPGGSTDIVARQLAGRVGNALGQPLVVENRPGGNGIIGTQALLAAPPDGHALIMGTADTHTIPAIANPRLPYDLAAFVPVTAVAGTVAALVTRMGLGATDVARLAALARRASPTLTYASYGIGSVSHVAGEMFGAAIGAEMTHVPYQGSGPAVIALTADQVDLALLPMAAVHPQRERLRVLAVASAERFGMTPGLPTLTESGVPVVAVGWIGLLAAPRTPREVADSLHAAMHEALSAEDVGHRLSTSGFSPMDYGPDRFAGFLRAETERLTPAVRAAGITADG